MWRWSRPVEQFEEELKSLAVAVAGVVVGVVGIDMIVDAVRSIVKENL